MRKQTENVCAFPFLYPAMSSATSVYLPVIFLEEKKKSYATTKDLTEK